MSIAECPQCGLVASLANEQCPRCGIELKHFKSERQDLGGDETPIKLLKPIAPNVEVGNVLGSTISLFFSNLWLISKLVFVIYAPFEIFKALTVSPGEHSWQVVGGIELLGLVCKALIAPSLIYALLGVMQTGVAPSLSESYRWGLSKLGRFCVCVALAWALQAAGMILCVIPGIIIAVAFTPIYPMASLENRGPIEILKRSWELTKGYRWNIFGATFVMTLLCGTVNVPATIANTQVGLSGPLWPIAVALAMVVDIASEATTVLSLVVYLSILASRREEPTKGIANNPNFIS